MVGRVVLGNPAAACFAEEAAHGLRAGFDEFTVAGRENLLDVHRGVEDHAGSKFLRQNFGRVCVRLVELEHVDACVDEVFHEGVNVAAGVEEHAHAGFVRRVGDLLVGGLEQFAEGCGRDEGTVLRSPVVAHEPAVDAASGDALDNGNFVFGETVNEFKDRIGVGEGVGEGVAHETRVAENGEQGVSRSEDVFFVGSEVLFKKFFAVVRVEFGDVIIVVFPIFDSTADAFALGFAVEAAVDIAVDIAADFAVEAGELLEFGIIAPRIVGIGGNVDVAAGADVSEIGQTVEVVAEAWRCVVRDKTADNFLGSHGKSPLMREIWMSSFYQRTRKLSRRRTDIVTAAAFTFLRLMADIRSALPEARTSG